MHSVNLQPGEVRIGQYFAIFMFKDTDHVSQGCWNTYLIIYVLWVCFTRESDVSFDALHFMHVRLYESIGLLDAIL